MVTSDSWRRINRDRVHWAEGEEARVAGGAATPAGKRCFDLVVASVGLIALAPVMGLIAAAVRMDSRRPVLYRARRMGQNGREFACLKFRIMTDEERVTRVGAWLRRHGLDELPQLVNVLRGEMSVVGPRPVMARDRADPPMRHYRRLEMQPGMTGMWAAQDIDCGASTAYVSQEEMYRRCWS